MGVTFSRTGLNKHMNNHLHLDGPESRKLKKKKETAVNQTFSILVCSQPGLKSRLRQKIDQNRGPKGSRITVRQTGANFIKFDSRYSVHYIIHLIIGIIFIEQQMHYY